MPKTITVAGVTALLENVPGSAITRVTIDGMDRFVFDPTRRRFSVFGDLRFEPVTLELPELQLKGLVLELLRHDVRRRWFVARTRQQS